MPKKLLCIFIILILSAAYGCSSGGSANVVAPVEAVPGVSADAASSHCLWGIWQFSIDPAAGTLDAVPLRGMEMHLNALPFLEPPALLNLTLETLQFNGNIIDADIGLRHPFLGLTEFSGFDVCGIFITNGSMSGFDDADLVMAGEGDTRLLNPDGYTRWWNPSEFPINTGTIFGYNDGLLGAPDSVGDYNCTLNGYKYFCDDLDDPDDPLSDITIENRGLFSAGQKNVRHYTIEMGGDGLVFNYAVDASWQFPQGNPPYQAPDDFAPEANRPEPYRIEVTELDNTLYNELGDAGGDISLSIGVYDWFNADMNNVRVEAPGEVPATESAIPIGGGEGYSTYQIDIEDCTPDAPGDLDLLITIESDESDYGGLLTGETMSAYFIHTTTVDDEAPVTSLWSEEFIVSESNGRFPVIAQTPLGSVIAAWSTSPGVAWDEFTFPDSWATPGTVTSSVDAVRMSIEPGYSGDDILITTQNYGGTISIAGVVTEIGHPMLYMWDGSTTWNLWDNSHIMNQLIHHTNIDSEGKYQWYHGTQSAYGHPVHIQYSTWQQDQIGMYDYLNYYNTGYPNCSELGYSRCWDDDSTGNSYIIYEFDRLKNPYQAPVDYRGLVLCKQFLPNMSSVAATYIVDQGSTPNIDSPSLVIDSTNRVHVVYRRYTGSAWQVVHRWSDSGTSWSGANETIIYSGTDEPEKRYISVDVDSQDRLHVTFKVDADIWYTRCDNGTTWNELEWVNESAEDLIDSADYQQWMFVDEDDQVHVVWMRKNVSPSFEFGAIYHRWRLDG